MKLGSNTNRGKSLGVACDCTYSLLTDMASPQPMLKNLHSEYSRWDADEVKVFFENEGVDLTSLLPNGPVTGADLDKLLVDLQKPTSEVPISDSQKQKIQGLIKSLQYQQYKIFNDPIHGSIEVHPLLEKIINTPEFHRLKDIKQLGGAHYVYPGATHTRFEHSIGVCYIAGEFAQCLQRKQPELKITDKDVLCVQIAGLCHDLGHGPFSHLFEKGVVKKLLPNPKLPGDKWKHEKISRLLFGRIYKKLESKFRRYGLNDTDSDFIKDLMEGYRSGEDKPKMLKPKKSFLYEIVANNVTGIDVDKWDYFARDCHYLGIPNDFNWRRCMLLSRVIEDPGSRLLRICFRDKEAKNLYGMFRTRSSLHRRAYQHKTTSVVEHMIAEAICNAKDVKLVRIPGQKDLKTIQQVVDEVAPKGDVEGYLQLTDYIIQQIKYAHLKEDDTQYEHLQVAQKLLERIEARDLFHFVGVHLISDSDTVSQVKPKELEQSVIDSLPSGIAKDVHVQAIPFSFGSDSEDKSKDPVGAVLFYHKDHPWELEDTQKVLQKVSELMVPCKFEEMEVRVYNKSKKHSSSDEDIAKAFKEWCGNRTPERTPQKSPSQDHQRKAGKVCRSIPFQDSS